VLFTNILSSKLYLQSEMLKFGSRQVRGLCLGPE
jgi:hypothetical protein